MADMLAEDTDSIVRRNLLTQEGYTPYCGADTCALRWPLGSARRRLRLHDRERHGNRATRSPLITTTQRERPQ